MKYIYYNLCISHLTRKRNLSIESHHVSLIEKWDSLPNLNVSSDTIRYIFLFSIKQCVFFCQIIWLNMIFPKVRVLYTFSIFFYILGFFLVIVSHQDIHVLQSTFWHCFKKYSKSLDAVIFYQQNRGSELQFSFNP